MALGGQAGARLAARFWWRTSPDTLLRLVHMAPAPAASVPQVSGVDEWAWRRGRRSGTLLVHRADHRIIDLLPERSVDAVALWLTQHPTVTVVCRDRRALYADGMRRGAPDAVQVVDRFHPVNNLREVLEALLLNHRSALQAAAVCTARALTPPERAVPVTPMYRGRRDCAQARQQRLETEQQQRHAAWVTTYKAIHMLHAQGISIAAIARQLGISRPTVYAYLLRRWREGCTDSMQLWREMRALGSTHSARTVSRFITVLRRASEAGLAPEVQASPYAGRRGPSARRVAFALVCPAAQRSDDAQLSINQLCQ